MSTSAGGGIGNCISMKAAADLSSYQYRFMRVSAANTVNLAGTGTDTSRTIGILQDKPASANKGAKVQIDGVSKLVMGGTCSAGHYLASGTDGRGVIADNGTDTYTGAFALEAASAAGDIISVKILQSAFSNGTA